MSICSTSPTLPAIREELSHCLQRACELAGCPAAIDALDRCLFLLDALALTTMEYAVFRNRLRNAQRYSMQAEWGAARFEMRLLLRSLAGIA
jgi:hypothetical protein